MGKATKPKDVDQDLVEFMMRELGGEQEVMARFFEVRIVELAESGKTIGELIKLALDQGWGNTLNGMTLKALANLVNPGKRSQEPGKERDQRSGRLTKVEIEKVRMKVLGFLKDNPWQSKKEIAGGVGFPAAKLGPQLGELRKEDKLKTIGEKGGMRYALKGERTKGPSNE